MHSITYLQDRIDKEISQLDFNLEPKELYDPIAYMLSIGGKRLRPALALLSCAVFGGDIEKAMFPALAIEVFHNFTLIHDDIMDVAPIRRGYSTVYKKWNSNIAILSGDAMFAKAYELLIKTDEVYYKKILKVFNQTSIEVCEGQQYDMNFETQDNLTIPEYIEMIRLKTGVLIAACFNVGSIIAFASDEDSENIYKFGENLGIAFQLQDDLLDVYGDQAKFGKKIGGDIITNKKTFLLIKAFELANGNDLQNLKSLINTTEFVPEEKIKEVTNIYNTLGVKEITIQMIDVYYKKSLEYLEKLSVAEERKAILRAFAEGIMKRDF